jgi:hypothetical protein
MHYPTNDITGSAADQCISVVSLGKLEINLLYMCAVSVFKKGLKNIKHIIILEA